MEYNHREIEVKWQKYWAENKSFKADNESDKPKYYILDMFPYPSGAGLHVGHPLGYIATDIFSRYKRHQGFNVLHPMGYDSFGLPAEQYAIDTGQHPALTTENNIARYREQLDKIGFSFDWDREIRTSDPKYYRWTQWIFAQLFSCWYNKNTDRAELLDALIAEFEVDGNAQINAACDDDTFIFKANEWNNFSKQEKSEILMKYRLAYQSFTSVNWCEALGTVLANDEVKDGVSVRGGHPVVKRMMRQWSLRITAYADRLLEGLERIDWTDSLKEMQRNWIGKSEGCSIRFRVIPHDYIFPNPFPFETGDNSHISPFLTGSGDIIEVFTTRPDTIFGVSFLTLAPEHELVNLITSPIHKSEVDEYVKWAKNRSELERMSEVKKISGVFSGAYVFHPFTGERIPVWIGDYVLSGYGTGAVMAVPSGDQRDWNFAKHFNIDIIPLFEGQNIETGAEESKEIRLINSDFLNGFTGKEAIPVAIRAIEDKRMGEGKINFRLRDAGYSRQRYWGEPFPIVYKNDIPELLPLDQYPTLPDVVSYKPTGTGEGPLSSVTGWVNVGGSKRETDTMPGYAGSSWYFLRYMDPGNNNEFVSKKAVNYWQEIDLYIGGSEHATGHLLYFRFWTKFLHDLGYLSIDEPAKKLINQGMIQGTSMKAKAIVNYKQVNSLETVPEVFLVPPNIILLSNQDSFIGNIEYNIPIEFVEFFEGKYIIRKERFNALKEKYLTFKDIKIASFNDVKNSIENVEINIGLFKYDYLVLTPSPEKMSKSKYNVVNPDDIVEEYGADTLRLYEMFLGPLEQSKPWNTNGITGVSSFLKKLWRLYQTPISSEPSTKSELKTLHKTIKKVQEDIERFSFNTSVSNFMICVNELTDLKCSKREILEPLLILLSPYAPHIAEELWYQLGHTSTISFEPFPIFNSEYLLDDNFTYPISFNGKTRFNLKLASNLTAKEIETAALSHPDTFKWLESKTPKKVIVVPKKIVNIVF